MKYTIYFAVLCIIVFSPFSKQGKTLIWIRVEDGLSQHLTALVYWGEYIRTFFGHLVSGKIRLPMWDMRLGMGADIFTTLNYYAIGDPLTILAAFVPRGQMEMFYSVLFFLRMYLAGFAFIAFCRYRKRSETGTLIGALCYIFCSFILLGATRHPFFINPLIYLPLLLMGIEKVLHKEKPYWLIFMTGIAAVSNFYFFYMLTVFMGIYTLVRCYENESVFHLKHFLGKVFRILKYYLLGLGLFAVMFLPILIGFVQNGRVNGSVKLGFQTTDFYEKVLLILFGSGTLGGWTQLGYLSILGIAMGALLFEKDKKYTKYRIGILVMGLGIGIPAFGFAFNGFSFVTNRWIFLLGFLLSYGLTGIYPKLFALSKRTKVFTGILILLYQIFCIQKYLSGERTVNDVIVRLAPGILMIVMFLWILLAGNRRWKPERGIVSFVLIGMVCINVVCQGYSNFALGTYTTEFLNQGEAFQRLMPEQVQMLQNVKDSSVYRVDAGNMFYRNYGVLSNLNTISGYYSITNKAITEGLRDQEQSAMKTIFKYRGLDQREELLATSSVKYITLLKGKHVPYGFVKVKSGKEADLYRNDFCLPFGYTYGSYITKKEYGKLNGVEKQNAILQTAAVEKSIPGYQSSGKDFRISSYSVKQQCMDAWKQTPYLSVKKENVYVKSPYMIRIPLKKQEGYVCYLQLKNIRIIQKEPYKTRRSIVRVKGNHTNRRDMIFYSRDQKNYYGEGTAVIPLEDSTAVKITLLSRSLMQFGDIRVISYKRELIPNGIGQMGKLKNIRYSGNRYSAESSFRDKQIAVIPIPYSIGWTAYVDGKRTSIYQMNDMYQGIPIEKGNHKIQMIYRTPGMKYGAVISGVCFLILLVVKWKGKRKKRRILK